MNAASRKLDLVVLALVLIAVAVVAIGTYVMPRESQDGVAVVSGEGSYPEPVTPTPAPTTDPLGLLPPPSEITSTQMVDIAQSEWADVLVSLRNSLITQDAAGLAGFLAPDGLSIGSDGAGYSYLSDPGTAAVTIFDDLFQAGSAPVIQGYFVEGCLSVFTTGWQGAPDLPVLAEYGIGAPAATTLPDSAYMWQVCEGATPGSPYISDWRAGDYYEIVIEKYNELAFSYEDETEIEDWPLYTIVTSW